MLTSAHPPTPTPLFSLKNWLDFTILRFRLENTLDVHVDSKPIILWRWKGLEIIWFYLIHEKAEFKKREFTWPQSGFNFRLRNEADLCQNPLSRTSYGLEISGSILKILRVYLSKYQFEAGSNKVEVVGTTPPTGTGGKIFF